MERQLTLAGDDAPPESPERTAASGWVLRAAATLLLIGGFGQPAFAGVYLSGEFDGLTWHVLGADLVSYLSIAQLGAAVAVWIRVRRAWPFWSALALTTGVFAQYLAGMEGALWLHLPLGVALIAGIAVTFAALWMRPLPRRVKAVRTDA
ncbi:hypothetical protein [Glycomyces sp. NPDC021274]|uniref:hypothetical protein n=1 Tax=Glycomyces sp. NPDC021274 TaxID=3155120 RepID=UPI0033DF4A0C